MNNLYKYICNLKAKVKYFKKINPWIGNYRSISEAISNNTLAYKQNIEPYINYARNLNGVDVEAIDMHLLAAILFIGNCKNILDYGGGLGNRYLSLRNHINVNWTVLELPHLVKIGQREFPEISFCTHTDRQDFDVVIFCGVLQMIDDWESVLNSQNPKWIIIENLFTHDEQTTVSTKSDYALRIFNASNFEDFLHSIGTIALTWSSPLAHEIRNGNHLVAKGYLIKT